MIRIAAGPLSLCLLFLQRMLFLYYDWFYNHYDSHLYWSGPRPSLEFQLFCAELLQMGISLFFLLLSKRRSGVLDCFLKELVRPGKWEVLKVAVPAFLFTFQGHLLMHVSPRNPNGNRSFLEYFSWLKISLAVGFSVWLLGMRPSPCRWVSFMVLTVGILITQNFFEQPCSVYCGHLVVEYGEYGTQTLLMVLYCLLSSFSCVYFQTIMKNGVASLWMRSFQISLFGTILQDIGAMLGAMLEAS